MKIKVIPTSKAPTHYSFDGEKVQAHYYGYSEEFDFSEIEIENQLSDFSVDELGLDPMFIFRDAYRDSDGELYITICQQVGAGHWGFSESLIDSSDYDPSGVYVVYKSEIEHHGRASVVTSEGVQWVL